MSVFKKNKNKNHHQTLPPPSSCLTKLKDVQLLPKGDHSETFRLQAGNAAWAPPSCSQMHYITGTCSTDNTFLWNKAILFQPGLAFGWLVAEGPWCPQSRITRGRAVLQANLHPALSWSCSWRPDWPRRAFTRYWDTSLQREAMDGPTPPMAAAHGASLCSSTFSNPFSPGVAACWTRAARELCLLKPRKTLIISCKRRGQR